MNAALLILAIMLVTALAAAVLRKLMHAALFFAISFIALAGVYFSLGAEFVGLVQIFVYIGAVAVLIVFTILLTKRETTAKESGFNWSGVVVALAVFAGLTWSISRTKTLSIPPPAIEPLTVRQIGETLMLDYTWPLLCVGLLLTVALLGGLILAMEEREDQSP